MCSRFINIYLHFRKKQYVVSMTRKCLNHRPQTNLGHHEEGQGTKTATRQQEKHFK